MTDRAVQPEAPIFEVTEEQAREIVDEWVRLYGTRHPDGSISFPRAASQERPQPPLHGHQSGGDWYECTDEHRGVAQERPQPDPWPCRHPIPHDGPCEPAGVAQERPSIERQLLQRIVDTIPVAYDVDGVIFAAHEYLAGGSVASPEPSE
jgi:hypothetical protein